MVTIPIHARGHRQVFSTSIGSRQRVTAQQGPLSPVVADAYADSVSSLSTGRPPRAYFVARQRVAGKTRL
jgi:hypothetical protein